LQTKVVLSDSIQAPIKKGDKVGKIIVTSPTNTQEGNLVSGEAVEKIGYFKRALRYIGIDA
jgi:D-alanyl-D-alanine carboxypeptidase